jgi:hypothetical protein
MTGVWGLGIVLAALATGRADAQDDQQNRKIAAEVARPIVVKLMENWKLEIDQNGFRGEVKAIDPGKNVKVEIDELIVVGNRTSVRLTVALPLGAIGKYGAGDDAKEVKAEIDTTSKIAAQVEWFVENNRVVLRPKVASLDLDCKVREVQPASQETKEVAQKLCDTIVKEQKDRIVRDINKALEKND